MGDERRGNLTAYAYVYTQTQTQTYIPNKDLYVWYYNIQQIVYTLF